MIPGIWGHPYLDLGRYVDTAPLLAIDDEICFGLTQVATEYTGGSHRTLGIVPPSLPDGGYADYGEVIRRFTQAEFSRFVALSDTPEEFDPAHFADYQFGEEMPHPLSQRQMQYLKYRYGVYFPWQVFYEMIPTANWADKSTGAGKRFTQEARDHFPKTLAWVRSLPFAELGRCNILGLEADHHGTVHQDGVLDDPAAEHFITVCPRGDKRLFLWDEDRRRQVFVNARVYWFNDHGYHGVAPDPYFRYSLRIDGVFTKEFLVRLQRDFPRGSASGPPAGPLSSPPTGK